MPDATLVAFYPGYGIAHVGRIRRPRRIRQWRGADAGCDACRVLSDIRERTCRADEKKSAYIKQQYYPIQDWQSAGLKKPSWVDLGNIYMYG